MPQLLFYMKVYHNVSSKSNNFIIDKLLPHFKISILQNVMYLPKRVGLILETATIVFLWKVVSSTNNVCSICSKWIFWVHAVHGLKIIDLPLWLHQSGFWNFFRFYSVTFGAVIKFQITCNSVLHTPNKSLFCEWILSTKLKAISPVALRGNQADSAIIGVIVLNDSHDFFSKQFFWLRPKCFINATSMTNLAWYAEEN